MVNYIRDFPFIWEEMMIPITYKADRARAEQILLDAAHLHAINPSSMTEKVKQDLQERFAVEPIDLEPKVFYRLTDNWLELSVRFIVGTHQIRNIKDAMSRYVITELDKADIGIASATYDIVGFPAIEVRQPQQQLADNPTLEPSRGGNFRCVEALSVASALTVTSHPHTSICS